LDIQTAVVAVLFIFFALWVLYMSLELLLLDLKWKYKDLSRENEEIMKSIKNLERQLDKLK
jgi:hypothetical protein